MADCDKENAEIGFVRILSLGMQMPMREYYICPQKSSSDGKKEKLRVYEEGLAVKESKQLNQKTFYQLHILPKQHQRWVLHIDREAMRDERQMQLFQVRGITHERQHDRIPL